MRYKGRHRIGEGWKNKEVLIGSGSYKEPRLIPGIAIENISIGDNTEMDFLGRVRKMRQEVVD